MGVIVERRQAPFPPWDGGACDRADPGGLSAPAVPSGAGALPQRSRAPVVVRRGGEVTTARGIGDGAAVFDGGALRHPGGEQIVVRIDLGVRRGPHRERRSVPAQWAVWAVERAHVDGPADR